MVRCTSTADAVENDGVADQARISETSRRGCEASDGQPSNADRAVKLVTPGGDGATRLAVALIEEIC
jgi:hypothetical protein